MPDPIPSHYATEFNDNWLNRIQQKQSRLTPYIDIVTFQGERKRFDRINKSTSQRRVERKAPTPVANQDSDNRWLYRGEFEIPAKLLDQADAKNLAPLMLPTSRYVENNGNEYNRNFDDLVCSVALGSVKTGADGTTDTALPGSQKIVAGGTGLTLAKLLSVNQLLLAAEVDDSTPRVLVVTAAQMTDLLNTTEVKNSDYNSVKALVNGQVDTFMGFKFVVNNRLPKASTTRSCVAFLKGSITMLRGGLKTWITERPDLSYATQIYSQFELGGTRLHDEAVVQIDCLES